MKFVRIADGKSADLFRVKDFLGEHEETVTALADQVGSGALTATGPDAVLVKRGEAAFSAGLGDHLAVIDGELYTLSERELLRGFDPAP